MIESHLQYTIADKNLINNVIVNLMNNAIDSLLLIETERKIRLTFSKNRGNRIIIKVSNNGALIPADIPEKIFIPFYTTNREWSRYRSQSLTSDHEAAQGFDRCSFEC